MSIIYCTATSLDGFIADDDSSLSWLFRTPDSDADPVGSDDPITLNFDTFFRDVGALVTGVNTLEWIREDARRKGVPFTWDFEIPSWVLTHRDVDLPDGVHRFEGDIRALHPLLLEAAGGRDIWIMGGGEVAGQFADAGLLDRVWVHINPVTLGAGAPLLPRRLRLHRERVERDGQFTAMLFSVVGEEPRDLAP
ncbi:dihydrofolate reductase family protein [Tessaracoccus antarcticus]|uniref:Dihydrofolate reductase n=1 Tax=Tessaracoccus antarcticus TaxID=2479848 RepID=A0A3M0G258_9ACTN|nr:dihydrofolate reductase family protein [Tessaracoccus antarcticus]RMB59014.1 dihydrofolate reductase [Tessaracoccus antarcticus]